MVLTVIGPQGNTGAIWGREKKEKEQRNKKKGKTHKHWIFRPR